MGIEEGDKIVEDQSDEEQLHGQLHFVSKLSNCILYCFYGLLHFVFIIKSMWYLAKFEFFRCNLYLFCRRYSFQIMYLFHFVLYYRTIYSSFTEFCMLF
ncbi:hypothetical protein MTR67_029592 [Solanum verrucosum]|uniref:Uncharacterized protein n=1 Tax=Solanum verrucosum TaxID=315347 RepID=A0AAF0R4K1_SOLVR|nr:hypothetical protein MTR67_029592 [Solanum verrucosum]